MSFHSFAFLGCFLPLMLGIYYILPERARNGALVLGSLLFYAFGVRDRLWNLALLAGLILVTYGLGCGLKRKKGKRLLLTLALVLLFGLLAGFKWSRLWSSGVLLPLGMSFYTFQMAGYLVDVYRGAPAERNFLRYSGEILLFPKLLSGPLTPYGALRPQMERRRYSAAGFDRGLREFILGLAMKVLLADQLGGLWRQVKTLGFESVSTALAWMGILAYSLQIYFDFCGYSKMARGLGRMLGFQLPRNFDHPYAARTMTEFWRRWHRSLGVWFRDYVYIPLGGNRKGIARRDANLLLTFLVSGLWHGANWTFLVWGGLHGLCQVAEDHMPAPLRKRKSLPLRIVGVPLTFAIFVTTFTIFRASSLGNAAAYFAGILHNPGHEVFAQYWLLGLTSKLELLLLLLGIALLVLVDVLHECGLHLRAWVNAAPRPVRWAVYEFAIFAFLLMASFYSNTGFLYARF